jgi:hypothetical protein
MSAPHTTPDERTLREFLLGNLAPERAEQVAAWLAGHPSSAEALRGLAADDLLTEALAKARGEEVAPPSGVERVIRSVLRELGKGEEPPPARTSEWSAGPGAPSPPGSSVSPIATVPVSSKVGGYRVIREIGRGGMGVVLEAEDEQLRRRVALKMMAPERARDARAKDRFLREARAAAAIEHENVVPIHHIGEEGGVPFIVMPLLRGESLEARLKREAPLSPSEVVRLGREVAAGLVAAHARGLVHRDVKPGNIWLDADTGRSKILDFGLAHAADGTDWLTIEGVIAGSPPYMAPEQADGQPTDARSDLFSLGATLYRCATGKQAFAGPTTTAILRAVTEHHPPPPDQVNPALPGPLSDLIVRLLAKEPAARPQSAQEIVEAFAALGEQPAGAARRSRSSAALAADAPARRLRSRWAIPVAVAVAAGLVLATIGGWLVTHRPNDPSPGYIRYSGRVDVLIERRDEDGKDRLRRLNMEGALPLRKADKFRVEGWVDPPAYVYVVWVDPGHDITPVYPWDPEKGWESRPAKEERTGRVVLPRTRGKLYTAEHAKPGVATMVLFARSTPLDVPDGVVRQWFEDLPELSLPPGGDHAAVWFQDYLELREPEWIRTFGIRGSNDPFARWQGQLQQVLGDQVAFQAAVSFARTGEK